MGRTITDEMATLMMDMATFTYVNAMKELGVEEVTDEKCMAVAELACADNDTLHNMPFEVTPESVAAAIKAADALGHYFLGDED